jgi:hypothetical protein
MARIAEIHEAMRRFGDKKSPHGLWIALVAGVPFCRSLAADDRAKKYLKICVYRYNQRRVKNREPAFRPGWRGQAQGRWR